MTSYSLRPATGADSAMLLRWRNDPATREWARTTHPITPAEHEAWFAAVLADPLRMLLVLERDRLAVASVRLDLADASAEEAEVSITVAPEARGRGIGAQALAATAAYTRDAVPNTTHILAVVNRDNEASLRLFRRAGYQPRNPADPTWLELVLPL